MDKEFDSITEAQPTYADNGSQNALHADYRRLASGGLQTTGGFVQLDYGDPKLRGQTAMKIYQEMGDDATCGVLIYLLQNIVKSVEWPVKEHSEDPEDVANAQFVESCQNDMDLSWQEFISAVLSMCQYGHAPFEQVYKRRTGRNPEGESLEPSKYTDGKIGWAGFQIIGQDTIIRWDFDENNRVEGVWQFASPLYKAVRIDKARLINFKTSNERDNPLGWSMFRRAYQPWKRKRALENIEGIAIERDLCGLPVVYAPPEVLSDDATPGNKAMKESLKKIVTDMRTDAQAGVLFPLSFNMEGKEQFRLELMNSGGSRTIDVGRVIDRYNNEIFRSSLADFLGLGQGTNASGSWAMHNDKTQLFLMGLRAYLKTICETLNRVAIPRLFELNGIKAKGYPEIYHTPLDQVDIQQLAAAVQSLASAGMSIFPNAEIERRFYELLGMPVPVQDDSVPKTMHMDVGNKDEGEPTEVFPGDHVTEQNEVLPGQGDPAIGPAKPLAPAAGPVDRDAVAAKPRAKPFSRFGR